MHTSYCSYSIKRVVIFIIAICLSVSVFGSDNDNDEKKKSVSTDKNSSYKVKTVRSFNKLSDYSFEEYAPVSIPYFESHYFTPPSENDLTIREKIEATFDKVKKENRFIDFLSEGALLDLPIGIKTDIGVLEYIILIDSVVMTPKESFLYASMKFETPQGKSIHFIGREIKFSREGGLSGDGKLALVGDYPINLGGDESQLIIKGSNDKTFVEFDCNGYKQVSLDASFLFSRNLLLPEDDKGNIIPDENVSIDFTTTLVDWDDIMVEANVPKFQVKGVKDVSFEVKEAVLDFSDTRNPGSVKFPQGYAEISPLLTSGSETLWRGVYIREVAIDLPPQFVKENKDEAGNVTDTVTNRVGFRGYDLILDNIGFSGRVEAQNLIPLEKGKIGNWNFSLETIYVNMTANELTDAGFNGKVNVPINKPKNNSSTAEGGGNASNVFTYNALIKPGNEYVFTVSNADTLNFDLWKANVTLNPTSYIEIKLANKKFLPKAYLDGQMTINVGLKSENGEPTANERKNVSVTGITFQGLEIQTVRPFVKVGSFSLGSPNGKSGMGGFPLSITNISGQNRGDELRLGMDITIGLIKESDGGFAANGRVVLVSEGQEVGNDLKYKFKRIDIESFGIDIDKGAFKFKGQLNFYKEDPVYGNGISGTVDATFNPGLQIQASAIFGTKDGERYWYVDALATFNSGITIFTGVAIYSFGGGAYYHMKLDTEGVGSKLGQTASGVSYVPDLETGFGFKATVGFGTQPGKKAFNADITYEMAFNKGGGVKYINLSGNGYFMADALPIDTKKLQDKVDKLAKVAKKYGSSHLNEIEGVQQEIHGDPKDEGNRAQVWAKANINYDFENRVLHGTFDAYMNVAGGILKGAGPGNKVGNVTLHFGPGEWYIYIGRPEPENRFAIEVLGIARMDAYFVMGSVIPDFPAPPDAVSEILGGIDLDFMADENALADGGGVGFGASFRVDTGNISFLIFYGRFRAGLGFDIMLKNYGDAECKGRGVLGVNGWYASAQAYAYFEGQIGIQIKIFGKRKKIPILEIGAAVVAQAKLPNPTWVRGIVGGYFRALGGLVKGRCKFEITIGEECDLIQKGSVLESIEVLAEITPQENSKNVSVFSVPQAIFNFEMEKEYRTVGYNDEIVSFKIVLEDFKIEANNKKVDADLSWNDDHTVAVLKPFDVLPPEQDVYITVTTSFQEFKNGYWVVSQVDGEKLLSTKKIQISTGVAPDYIPEENIAFSYPLPNQVNYYKGESSQGYIILKQGQPYLFEQNEDFRQVLRVKTISGQISNSPLTYVQSAKEVRFTMPTAKLANNKIYEIDMVNTPKNSLGSIDANVDTVSSKVSLNDPNNELNIRTKEATGSLKEVKEKQIYQTFFRTSMYNTFNEKMASTNPSSGWRYPILPGVHKIGSNIKGPEPFAEEEIYEYNQRPPLIEIEADFNNVPWFNQEVYPLVYNGYPINPDITISADNRDPSILGLIPAKGVFIYQYPYRITLSDDDISTNAKSFPETVGRIDNYTAYFMYYDFLDLSAAAANYVIRTGNTSNGKINRLLNGEFPIIRKGNYWVNINYRLPGKNTVTSTYRHKIYNPLD